MEYWAKVLNDDGTTSKYHHPASAHNGRNRRNIFPKSFNPSLCMVRLRRVNRRTAIEIRAPSMNATLRRSAIWGR